MSAPGGVSGPGGVCSGGWGVLGGVCSGGGGVSARGGGLVLGGGSAPGVVSQHALRQTPPVNRMTNRGKNLPWPQLRCGR